MFYVILRGTRHPSTWPVQGNKRIWNTLDISRPRAQKWRPEFWKNIYAQEAVYQESGSIHMEYQCISTRGYRGNWNSCLPGWSIVPPTVRGSQTYRELPKSVEFQRSAMKMKTSEKPGSGRTKGLSKVCHSPIILSAA